MQNQKHIVHLRGIVASGKSTAIKRVMRQLGNFSPARFGIEGYVRPAPNPVYVLGSYHGTAGGLDRFMHRKGGAPTVLRAIAERSDSGYQILMECSRFDRSCVEVQRLVNAGYTVNTLILDTPPERAVQDWNERGRSPLTHTLADSQSHYACLMRTKDRLVSLGLPLEVVTRKDVVDRIIFLLTTPLMLQ